MACTNTCEICVEPITCNRNKFDCECGFSACRTCVVRYVEGSDNEPRCMSCNQVWSREQLYHMMPQTVCKRMIAHAADVEVRRQKAMLPSTAPFVEMRAKHKNLVEKFNENRKKIWKYQERERKLKSKLDPLNDRMASFGLQNDPESSEKRKSVLGSCTKSDCRGFIDSSSGVCCVCSTKHCKSCLEEKTDNHECDEDVLATIRLVRESCKPCPKCNVSIHKINGCNDMFCTSCSTAFCWRTGNIHYRGNSNPHYYDWIRNNRVDSSTTFDPERLFMDSQEMQDLPAADRNTVIYFLREIRHIETEVRRTSELHNETAHNRKALIMRAKYMESKDPSCEQELKTRVKKLQTDTSHTSMIVEATQRIGQIREAVLSSKPILKKDGVDGLYAHIRPIVDEFNERSAHIGKIFGRKPHATISFKRA
jgi:hypothetical protein